MISVENIYSMLSAWILWGWLLTLITAMRKPVGRYVLLLLLPALFIPLDQSPLWAITRGIVHDLSLPAIILMVHGLMIRLWRQPLIKQSTLELLLLVIAVVGVVFYPMALGLTQFDPYAAGYSAWFALGMIILATGLWAVRQYELAAILALAVGAMAMGVLDSGNLWDYLIDPLVWIAALIWTTNQTVRLIRVRITAQG